MGAVAKPDARARKQIRDRHEVQADDPKAVSIPWRCNTVTKPSCVVIRIGLS